MFGWLAAFGVCQRTHLPSTTTRWLAVSPHELAFGLAQLGCVLYLPPRRCVEFLDELPAGLLAETTDLTPLLRTCFVGLTSAVTAEGPREWIECVDGNGDSQARIYLLPDTDYLAWDALFADAVPVDGPPRARLRREIFFASQAKLVCFTRRTFSSLAMLGSERPKCVSPLGRGVARDIAVAEAVSL
jgi:hypothetical protein